MQCVKVLISAVLVLAAAPLVARAADFDGSKTLRCSPKIGPVNKV